MKVFDDKFIWCFFICWLYVIYTFFTTYGVSFCPLEVSYRATRVFDSGWMESLEVRVYFEFSLILVRLISSFNIII
jgi:hypothetical protein